MRGVVPVQITAADPVREQATRVGRANPPLEAAPPGGQVAVQQEARALGSKMPTRAVVEATEFAYCPIG